jgi:hypothetical protein
MSCVEAQRGRECGCPGLAEASDELCLHRIDNSRGLDFDERQTVLGGELPRSCEQASVLARDDDNAPAARAQGEQLCGRVHQASPSSINTRMSIPPKRDKLAQAHIGGCRCRQRQHRFGRLRMCASHPHGGATTGERINERTAKGGTGAGEQADFAQQRHALAAGARTRRSKPP